MPGHGQPGPEELPTLRELPTPLIFRAAESFKFKTGPSWPQTSGVEAELPADSAPVFLKKAHLRM